MVDFFQEVQKYDRFLILQLLWALSTMENVRLLFQNDQMHVK